MKSKQSKHKINMIKAGKTELKQKQKLRTENRELPGTAEWYVTLPLFSTIKRTCSWLRKLVETIYNNFRIKICKELNGNMH